MVTVKRLALEVPLPIEMQGRWTDIEEPTLDLIIRNGEINYSGNPVLYDYKLVDKIDAAITVSLKVNDPAAEDSFQRANITELVITPEGEFHAYNVKFASRFKRAEI